MDLFDFFRKKRKIEFNEDQDKLVKIQKPEINFDTPDIVEEKVFLKTSDKPKQTRSKPIEIKEKKHYEGHRQRLKEKILKNSIETLPDYELLEAVLTYCIPRNDVKPLAKNLIKHFLSLKNIFLSHQNDFKEIKGIGESTLCFFKIMNEIYCRFNKIEIETSISLNTPEKVAVYCQARMGNLKYEQFRVLFLNKKNKLIQDVVVQNGTLDKAAIFPRELVIQALNIGAGALILVHNHPSGDPTPSQADIDITNNIKKSLSYMEILLYDHIIIGKNAFYSMKSHKIF